jgi:hypothetical protein
MIGKIPVPSVRDQNCSSEPPLWSIGLAVAIILGAPLILYSLAPSGPLRDGDTVFSDGQQRVQLSTSAAGLRLQANDTCLLDPSGPLIVVHAPSEQADGVIVAQVQGSSASEWPFCPLHAEVLIKTHQVFQKPGVFSTVKEMVTKLSDR